MFVLAAIICVPVFLAVSGADLLVESIRPDELSNMGVDMKS